MNRIIRIFEKRETMTTEKNCPVLNVCADIMKVLEVPKIDVTESTKDFPVDKAKLIMKSGLIVYLEEKDGDVIANFKRDAKIKISTRMKNEVKMVMELIYVN